MGIFDKVAPVHLDDARERYWILWRELEMLIRRKGEVAGLDSCFNNLTLNLEYREIATIVKNYFDTIDKTMCEHIDNGLDDTHPSVQATQDLKKLMQCYKILAVNKKRLTRLEGDLNTLWRDMTVIRIRLLTEDLIDSKKLPLHLDFCREEARRLQLHETPEISELIHSAAMELDTEDGKEKKNRKTIRIISSILSQLTEKRLQRMHVQVRNKNTCQLALGFLVPLSFILLYSHKLVLFNSLDCCESMDVVIYSPTFLEVLSKPLNEIPRGIFDFFLGFLVSIMGNNPLAFIFFGGLLGGFFSAAMRFHNPVAMTGSGPFFRWYTLTKPFVGALGATILYIIIVANFKGFELQNINSILEEIGACPYGAKGFAFAFLTGFSERIVMPKLK